MKRNGLIGLCLLAAFAVSGVAAGSALAAPPFEFGRCLPKKAGGEGFSDAGCTKHVTTGAKFEWTNVILKNKFKSHLTSSAATLEGEGGEKVSCTKEVTEGAEITGPKAVGNLVEKFSGCASSGVPCNSAGKGSGAIDTAVLEGELARAGSKLGIILFGPGHGAWAEFECSGLVQVTLKGSMAGGVLTNKMFSTVIEKVAATKAEQKPSVLAGEPCEEKNPVKSKDNPAEAKDCDNHNLVVKSRAATVEPEEAGWSQTKQTEFEEKIEASSVN